MFNSFLAPGLYGDEIAGKGGRGVFAELPIPRGTLLVVFGGDAISRKDVERLTPELRPLVIQVDEDCFLVSTKPGPADWVNHSCEPNAGIQGQITLVALRDISVGEEITFDYAMCDGCDYDEFPCGCGARTCRGRVTGEDWRKPELIARYQGYRSTYLDVRLAREGEGRERKRSSRPLASVGRSAKK